MTIDWLPKLDAMLLALDEKPQFKWTRDFPFDAVTVRLRDLFQDQTLSIEVKERGWVKKAELTSQEQSVYTLTLPPLKEPCFISIQADEVVKLLSDDAIALPTEMSQGFVSYFLAEVMHQIESTAALQPMTFRVEKREEPLSSEEFFRVDLGLKGKRGGLWSVLLFSPTFRKEWNDHFSQESPRPLSERAKEQLIVDLGVQLGQATFSLKELKEVQVGDFLLLDNCLYDPETKRGSLIFTLQQTPLFRGRVKDGVIKLADYPLYEEVTTMDEEMFEDDEEFDEDDDELDDVEEQDEEEELDFSEEEKKALATARADSSEELKEDSEEKTEKSSSGEIDKERIEVALDEVEVQVTVEVCRIRMSAKELMELTSGNVLNLDLPLDHNVDLVVGGKRFGKASLMRMGDHLGVRVLQLAGKS